MHQCAIASILSSRLLAESLSEKFTLLHETNGVLTRGLGVQTPHYIFRIVCGYITPQPKNPKVYRRTLKMYILLQLLGITGGLPPSDPWLGPLLKNSWICPFDPLHCKNLGMPMHETTWQHLPIA